MKIEKVNDNQIRCTLTKEDLNDRQLKLSELAYGTEKAKILFRDMMQQAAYEFGFEAEDIPLMIEAIPLSADTIILIITKVEYPEEIDTRFSKFSEGDESDFDSYQQDGTNAPAESADDILGLYKKIQEERQKAEKELKKVSDFVPLEASVSSKNSATKKEHPKEPVDVLTDITKLFVFQNLDDVTKLAHVLNGFYYEQNDLYKNLTTKKFYLVIHKGSHTPEDFNKVCNILSEYAYQERYSDAVGAYFEEHFEPIVSSNALSVLANL
ncbi:MAG: adaptor protein MecA [Lachnospiraceae bacterium]|nr:adaptor protein MecA [Lachnospiraceae bacterium]